MMENCQETCNKSDQIEESEIICQVNTMDEQNADTVIANEENYNFGAEITKQIDSSVVDDVVSVANDDDDSVEIKTINAAELNENVTSTKIELACGTETAAAAATVATATTSMIITETASTASDSGISQEKCQSDKCDYDTTDIGEDEADDENEDSPDDEDSQQQAIYAHNAQPRRNRDDSNVESSDDDDDEETSTSTDSDFSDISGLSDVSGKEWKPVNRKPILWVQKQIHSGRNPRELLSRFLPAGAQSITLGLNDMSLWRLLANMLSEPPRRQKLRHVNTFEDVIQLILKSKNIVVLTGAGVSVSCGIPDFRSSDGIYSRLAKDYPNLPDPQAMFDIDYFSRDPRPFYKFAREIYPGQFKPSPCHRFIKLLEEKEILLRNYTQNIDTLEQVAGIKRVIECHGSFSTASCTKCKYKCDADAIRADIFAQRIPVCPLCQPHVHQSVDASDPVSENDLRWIVANGIMKPDIVFFGEGLPDEFHKVMASDKDKCDLLIVIGSSLKVRPVALIPSSLPANVPQILINREQLNHLEFDVELLGDSDVIINQICHRLGADWKQICYDERVLKESKELEPFANNDDYDEVANDELDDEIERETAAIVNVCEMDSPTAKTSNVAACSDSGFESSTSMGQNEMAMLKTTPQTSTIRNLDELSEIENIKTSILEFNEKPMESDFQPFKVRLGQDALMTPPPPVAIENESLRHLSIDSTKDSGIQCCDSSNSMVTTTTTGSSAEIMLADFNEMACSSSSAAAAVVAAAAGSTSAISSSNFKDEQAAMAPNDTTTHSPAAAKHYVKRRTISNSCSAADLLIDGTYYYHKHSSSYVFPGAQISWYADGGEDDDDDEDTQNTTDDIDEEDDDDNCEGVAHKAHESATDEQQLENYNTNGSMECDTTKNANGIKRSSTSNISHEDSLPPLAKKCRLESENVAANATTAATAILTTTINTNTNCSDDDGDGSNTNCAPTATTTKTTATSLQEATSTLSTTLTLPPVTTTKEATLQHI